MYPIAIIICFIISMVILFVNFQKKTEYTNGKKVANTSNIKETDYYKSRLKKYKIISNLVKIVTCLCIITTSILISRPTIVKNENQEKYNRDIIIDLDISLSECDVNLELVRNIKKIIPDIEGDRIGIVLFNTAPIVYCPLTDDYDYVNECLDKIERQLKLVVDNGGKIPFQYDIKNVDVETESFWYGGTIANSETRGSSLIGDGLARRSFFIA